MVLGNHRSLVAIDKDIENEKRQAEERGQARLSNVVIYRRKREI
jgi:hypothetical protein